MLTIPVQHIEHYSSSYHVRLLRLLGWVLTGVLGDITMHGDNSPLDLDSQVSAGASYSYLYTGDALQLNMNHFIARRDLIAKDDHLSDSAVSESSDDVSTSSEVSDSSGPNMDVTDRDKVCILSHSLAPACDRAHIVPQKLRGCDGLHIVLQRSGISALDDVTNLLLLHHFLHKSWNLGDVLLLATDTRFIPAFPPQEEESLPRLSRAQDRISKIPTTHDETWTVHYQERPWSALRTTRIQNHFTPRERVEMLRDEHQLVHGRVAKFDSTLAADDAPSRDALHMLYGVALIRRYISSGWNKLLFAVRKTGSKRQSHSASSKSSGSGARKRSRPDSEPSAPPSGTAPLNALSLGCLGAETEYERERRLNLWVRQSA